jgi:hypothetical protein
MLFSDYHITMLGEHSDGFEIYFYTDRPIHRTSLRSEDQGLYFTTIKLHTADPFLAKQIYRKFLMEYLQTGSSENALEWLLKP